MNNMATVPVIAIDGPSGSGKGTVSTNLSNKLGWNYLDSGALYRVLAYLATARGISFSASDVLAELASNLDVRFVDGSIWLDGARVSDEIRTEDIGASASLIAPIQAVREALHSWQRNQAQSPGLVADGRDMGTVVFRDAVCKLFITASIQVRAERRYKQLIDKGFDVSIRQLSEEIEKRDERDMNRKVSPLCVADDAIVIDTTSMMVEQVDAYVFTTVQPFL